MFMQKNLEIKDQFQSQAHLRPQNRNKSAISISAQTLPPSNPSDKPQLTAKSYIPLKSSTPAATASAVTFCAVSHVLPGVTLSSAMVSSSVASSAANFRPTQASVPGTFLISNSFSLPVSSTHSAPTTTSVSSMTNKHTLTTRPPLSSKSESILRITPEPANASLNKNLANASQASPVSRPSSAPGLPPPAMKTATPMGTPAQVSPHLSRSVSSSGRVGMPPDMDSSPTASGTFPQSYLNAITRSNSTTLMGSSSNLNSVGFTPQSSQSFSPGVISTNSTTSQSNSSHGHQSTSFGQIGVHASTTGTFQSDSSFFSSSLSFKPPTWKHGMDRLSNDESLEQAGSSGSIESRNPSWSPHGDPSRPQPLLGSNWSEDPRDPPNWRAKIADEFPHMDIINDLLEEPIRLPNFTFPSWWMPIAGGRQQPSTGLAGGSSLFDTPEPYKPSFTRPTYGSNVREGHSFQFSNAPYYMSGQNDGFVQKHWGYDFTTDLNMNMGVDLNGISHSTRRDHSYMPGGVNHFKYPHDSGH
jgi:hypothetical protein